MANGFPKGFDGHSSERVEDGFELNSYTLGGTANDETEMRTLGRTQQLNVRIASVTVSRTYPINILSV